MELRGLIQAHLVSQGIASDIEPERAALSTLRDEWNEKFDTSYRKIHSDLRKPFEESLATMRANAEAQRAEFLQRMRENEESSEKQRTAANENNTKLLADLEQQRTDIIHKFNEHMSLKAPVDYWREKQRGHRLLSIVTAVVAIVVAAVGAFGLALIPYSDLAAVLGLTTASPYAPLAILGISFALFLWVLRILVRLMLSQIHLTTDAGERAVMAQTYLALFNEQKLDEKDRNIVLAALFRPTISGIVKEDSSPSSFYEAISKLLSGPR